MQKPWNGNSHKGEWLYLIYKVSSNYIALVISTIFSSSMGTPPILIENFLIIAWMQKWSPYGSPPTLYTCYNPWILAYLAHYSVITAMGSIALFVKAMPV